MGSIRARAAFAAILLTIGTGCASLGGNPEPIDNRDDIKSSGQGMEELFAGKFPGVEVLRVPSGGISIRIRGSNTFLGSSEPLYIIDGSRVQSGPNGLLFLDPSEIVKIEVLKDIGSTSIYGSDGANGVILITTKRAINE
jgi:TonB-dependent SusC/RagA subfamily outer membrane receptor